MIDVQFDTVLLSPAAADAAKIVATEYVVAYGSCDLSVLGIVCHAAAHVVASWAKPLLNEVGSSS